MAKKDEASEDGAQATQEVAPSGGSSFIKNHLMTVLLGINALLMGGVIYFQIVSLKHVSSEPSVQDLVNQSASAHTEAATEGEAAAKKDAPVNLNEGKIQDGILMQLDSFTANLAQGDGPRRYVRMQIVLKFSKDSLEGEFKSKQAQIRDSVISILNTKRPEDLLKAEGKTYLKEEIKSSVNSFLIDGQVMDVFYIGFQIN